jgi:hypothetical protein
MDSNPSIPPFLKGEWRVVITLKGENEWNPWVKFFR